LPLPLPLNTQRHLELVPQHASDIQSIHAPSATRSTATVEPAIDALHEVQIASHSYVVSIESDTTIHLDPESLHKSMHNAGAACKVDVSIDDVRPTSADENDDAQSDSSAIL
jgi:hypothetical protein